MAGLLADIFDKVVATDVNASQIESASRGNGHANITFAVAPAELDASQCSSLGLADGTVDMITVAQALHWFDMPRFNVLIAKLLRPGGVYLVVSYVMPKVSEPVDQVIRYIHDQLLKD
jgi:ubiquinone/menaquinone biosynthesis C-methylase UbiE